ncbi:hypothetical protein OIDMADRAFT_138728 [Oidiodendron maius Zn]|uniref:G-protein coupled receptors family 2 profile 2 domain-containing protein n=1 Tax=Oidiodendron maius (strain Zn) TaxID=913774 RepID=A0A0C3C259_OIDMZ|nr:hypothetical protein OIDMADRAFT_138728 [Oidiodendron maius Zn]
MTWTEKEFSNVQRAERVASILSLVGCFFVVITFCSSSAFHTPISRLIFYASFGNILSNVATLISREGVLAGQNSVLCQLQAFFIQQWMPADSLWSFCMALNFYLTFYKRYTTTQLKSLEWKYFLACYGMPLIPSVTLLCVNSTQRGRIYGPAILWCSIDSNWQFLRLLCFYGPVWLVIIGTFTIYIIIGRDIFQHHRTLRSFVRPLPKPRPHLNPHRSTNAIIVEPTSGVSTSDLSHLHEQNHAEAYLPPTRQFSQNSINAESTAQSQPRRVPATEFIMNRTLWSYLRCSFLFFIALVVTWIPSSINRIYSIAYPDSSNYGLNFAGSFVLPLQGFWNAILYTTISTSACKELWRSYVTRRL